jgi:hypothetical protein
MGLSSAPGETRLAPCSLEMLQKLRCCDYFVRKLSGETRCSHLSFWLNLRMMRVVDVDGKDG